MAFKKFAIGLSAALIALSTQAAHAHGGWGYAPPKRFAGEPKMKVLIIPESTIGLQKRCGNKLFPISVMFGCARIYQKKDGKSAPYCVVYIPKANMPNYAWPEGGVAVVTPKMVLTHEKAHCAGWPSNHPR